MMGDSVWTDARVEQLKKLFAEGLSGAEIQRRFGGIMSRNAVIGKLHRLGLVAANRPRKTRNRRTPMVPRAPRPPRVEKPKKPFVNGFHTTTHGTQEADASIRAFLKSDETRQPPDTCLTLAELTERSCRFVIGDPLKHEKCFCAKETVALGVSWCAEHLAVCYPGASVEKVRATAAVKATLEVVG